MILDEEERVVTRVVTIYMGNKHKRRDWAGGDGKRRGGGSDDWLEWDGDGKRRPFEHRGGRAFPAVGDCLGWCWGGFVRKLAVILAVVAMTGAVASSSTVVVELPATMAGEMGATSASRIAGGLLNKNKQQKK